MGLATIAAMIGLIAGRGAVARTVFLEDGRGCAGAGGVDEIGGKRGACVTGVRDGELHGGSTLFEFHRA